MDSERNESESKTAPVSTVDDGRGESSFNKTIDDGPGSTCEDGASDWKRWVNVESTIAGPMSDPDWQWRAIESGLDGPDGETDLQNGRGRDADGTFFWDPQDTCVPLLESTVWPLGSALLATTVCGTEAVAGFEILSELGHGGMGIVYKARHLRLKRLVALKVIRNGRHRNREDLARFQIEAEVAARLNHPNIVRIYEIGKADDVPFVALELLEGGTLKERLAGTPQPLRESAALLATLARAVHAAHVAGVLHRDIKPSNVLFDRDGIPKIADFGLAKRMDVEEGETITGQVIGTPSYMAPEQAQGWAREIGHAVDIYALGAVLYEMLTGRPPIKGETGAETIKLVLEEDPVSPSHLRPHVSFDLETICLKCIARDPRKRYANALALAEDLDRFLGDKPILARRTPLWERALKLSVRHPVITVVLATALVATGGIAGGFLHALERENVRVRGVLQTGGKEASDADGAVAKKEWNEAIGILKGLLGSIKEENDERIVQLRLRAQGLSVQADRGRVAEEEAVRVRARAARVRERMDWVRAQLSAFREHLDEAKFLDTRFGGLDPIDAAEATCREARASLDAFGSGALGDQCVLASLPEELTPRERNEVTNGFYELLLILADATAELRGAAPAARAEQALRIIDRAPAVRSGATRAYHVRRAAYLETTGDHEGAARERREADRLAPADALDLFLMGRELAMKGDYKGAITHLVATTQKQPEHFWAQCLLAICHFQLKEPGKAQLGFNACLQQKKNCPWLYLLRGLAYADEGNLARESAKLYPELSASFSAIKAWRFGAAEEDYRYALALLRTSPASADLEYVLLNNRGHIRLVRGDLPAAAADLQEAIRINDHRLEALGGLAHVYQRQGKTDLALDQIAKAIRLEPKRPELHRARADLLLGLEIASDELRDVVLLDLEDAVGNLSRERRNEALRELEVALQCEPPGKRGVAFDKLRQGIVFQAASRDREALDACNAALAIVPQLALAHHLRIQVLLKLKQYDNLIVSCDQALKSVKPTAELYELRGMAKDDLKDYLGAVEDYTLSLSYQPNNARVFRRRGWSYFAADAIAPADHDFEEAIRLSPKDGDAFSGRALVRAHLGRHDEATSDAEYSLKCVRKNWRIAHNAARVYALSAVSLQDASRKTGGRDERVVKRYLDRAFEHARLALDLAPADQHKTILADPALHPIRKWLQSHENTKIDQR
jgi:eukaryotic-like serine/threonine-protein kinase